MRKFIWINCLVSVALVVEIVVWKSSMADYQSGIFKALILSQIQKYNKKSLSISMQRGDLVGWRVLSVGDALVVSIHSADGRWYENDLKIIFDIRGR